MKKSISQHTPEPDLHPQPDSPTVCESHSFSQNLKGIWLSPTLSCGCVAPWPLLADLSAGNLSSADHLNLNSPDVKSVLVLLSHPKSNINDFYIIQKFLREKLLLLSWSKYTPKSIL